MRTLGILCFGGLVATGWTDNARAEKGFDLEGAFGKLHHRLDGFEKEIRGIHSDVNKLNDRVTYLERGHSDHQRHGHAGHPQSHRSHDQKHSQSFRHSHKPFGLHLHSYTHKHEHFPDELNHVLQREWKEYQEREQAKRVACLLKGLLDKYGECCDPCPKTTTRSSFLRPAC